VTGSVRIRHLAPLSQVDVRFDPSDGDLVDRVSRALAGPPPVVADSVTATTDGLAHWLWLGPDEWLVVGQEGAPEDSAHGIELALRAAAGDAFLTTVDVSANRIGLEVAGPDAQALLAFGCALDLDHPAFGAARCAQTLVARAAVILWQVDELPTYRLLVRPSFAAYLHAWLEDAAVGLG
jgi:sarcosine oxidase, subunit gamma